MYVFQFLNGRCCISMPVGRRAEIFHVMTVTLIVQNLIICSKPTFLNAMCYILMPVEEEEILHFMTVTLIVQNLIIFSQYAFVNGKCCILTPVVCEKRDQSRYFFCHLIFS